MRASNVAVTVGMAVGLAFVGSCGVAAASALVPLQVQEVVIPGGLQTHVPALADIAGPTPTMTRKLAILPPASPKPDTAPPLNQDTSTTIEVNDNLSLGEIAHQNSAQAKSSASDVSEFTFPGPSVVPTEPVTSDSPEPVQLVTPEVATTPADEPAPAAGNPAPEPAAPEPTVESTPEPVTPSTPDPVAPGELPSEPSSATAPPSSEPSSEPSSGTSEEPSGTTSDEPTADPETPTTTAPAEPEPSDPETEQPPTSPTVVGQMYTTDRVNLRTEPSLNGQIVRVLDFATVIDVTGVTQGDWTQVLDGDVLRWIHSDYLSKTEPAAPVEPTYLYTSADVNFRTGPGLDYSIIRLLLQGTRVEVIGESGNWANVTWSGTSGWVSYRYLQETAPGTDLYGSVGLNGVSANITAIVGAAQGQFPQLHVFYGIRASNDEHGWGRAVDIMLPDYLNNKPLGTDIASYFQQHASEFNIQYIIWYQRIWFPGTSYSAWEQMEDRGSDTQNHLDHVHITVRS